MQPYITFLVTDPYCGRIVLPASGRATEAFHIDDIWRVMLNLHRRKIIGDTDWAILAPQITEWQETTAEMALVAASMLFEAVIDEMAASTIVVPPWPDAPWERRNEEM